ncbi:MAG: AtpZ/AtpI family protein [Acidobacteriota bacterium]
MGLKDLAKNSPRSSRIEVMRSFGEVATVGLSFVLALMIGTIAGWWLDQKFGWKPWGFFGGFSLGLAAGVRNVYFVTRKYLK